MWIWFLQLHFQLLAGVGHLLALNFLQVKRTGRLCSDVHDVELTALEHTIELALSGTYRQCMFFVVLRESDGAVSSFLIVIVRALILIKFKAAVTTSIDIESDSVGRFLVAPFH